MQMTAGKKGDRIPEPILAEDYYDNLHRAHASMRDAFALRASEGLSQDDIAAMLNADKALISKRLKGLENLTLRTLSYMASALTCRLLILFQPHEEIPASNYYYGCTQDAKAEMSALDQKSVSMMPQSAMVP
jgi:transcriptional regulator with XRE-family HTH domain